MSDQLRRQIEILRLLPRPGLAKSTAEIFKELEERKFVTSKRTVERDLESLRAIFGHVIERQSQQGDNGRTNYWHLTSLKGLLPETLFNNKDAALALAMLKQQAYNRLPSSVLRRLDSIWNQASQTAETDNSTQKWMQLIQYLPDPMRPESPPINPDVQATIEEALDNGDALDITLQTLDGSKAYRDLLPVRLLLQEEILYLLAEDPNAQMPEDSITMLPLHRMTKAKAKFTHNDSSFEPDLAQGVALGVEDTIKLVIRVNRPLAEALFNRPIGRQQQLVEDSEKAGHFVVTTYIDSSPQLKRWLMRRIEGELEILEPAGLI